MKKRVIYILCILIALPSLSMGQSQKWLKYRKNIIFGVGSTSFLGDLGGGNTVSKPGPGDVNFETTKAAFLFGYRNNINQRFAVRLNLTAGMLSGDDKYTAEPYRKGRNLHFRSEIAELTALGELYLLRGTEKSIFRPHGVRKTYKTNFFNELDIYLHGGLGVMYFNPRAQYDGKWVPLQPIGTEGQGLPGQPDKYSRVTVTIPYGFGIQKVIDHYWSIGLEASVRMTFSDYIDDVSTNYYGRDKIRDAKLATGASAAEAERAAYLSDPNIYHSMPEIGIPRSNQLIGTKRGGSSNNDSFFTVMVTLNKKIASKTRRGYKKRTSRYTF